MLEFHFSRGIFAALLALALVAASGCGFHLRGKTELPASLARIAVVGSDRELVNSVKESLSFSGAEVLDASTAGQSGVTTLQLTREFYERRVRSVDSRGLATSYFLVYEVDFRLEDAQGEAILKRNNLKERRDFNFDSTQVLQKEGEERFLREDMQREIAQTILRILGTLSTANIPTSTAATHRFASL